MIRYLRLIFARFKMRLVDNELASLERDYRHALGHTTECADIRAMIAIADEITPYLFERLRLAKHIRNLSQPRP